MRLHAIPLDKYQTGVAVLCFNSNAKAINPATTSDVLNTSHHHAANSGDHLYLDVHIKLNVEWLNCRVSGSIDDLLEMFGVIWITTDSTGSTYNNKVPYVIEIELDVEFDEVSNANISPQLEALLLQGKNAEAAQLCLSQGDKLVKAKSTPEAKPSPVLTSTKPFLLQGKLKGKKKGKQKSSTHKGKK